MAAEELQRFELLKDAVAESFRQRHPGCTKPIQEWKGQEIVDFQEDLASQSKGRISEKWFYTHIKSEANNKLPRIDMLNLLSQYTGYRDWNDFLYQHKEKEEKRILPFYPDEKNPVQIFKGPVKRNWVLAGTLALAVAGSILLAGAMTGLFKQAPATNVLFCFVDAITGQRLPADQLEVSWLKPGESPLAMKTDESGCIQFESPKQEVILVVKAPYYYTDTLTRVISSHSHQEEIRLRPDDYALMIHLFSTSNLTDWKKRKSELQAMIADNARIFQVDAQGLRGMELFNKEDFINKLTLPLKSLKNIDVLEILYDQDRRIRLLRFTQKPLSP